MTIFKENSHEQCTAYRNLRDASWNANLRDFVETLWVQFEPFAEPGFRDAISRDFHQRFWEMYLCCALLNAKLTVQENPVEGPDFKIRASNLVTWIEAVVPTGGVGDDAVQDPALDGVSRVPVEKILLRLRSAIEEKSRKYRSYLDNQIVSAEDSNVIAINGGLIPYSITESDPPRILSAVLPIGERYVTFDRNTTEIVGQGYQYRGHIQKLSGAEVPTTLFTSESYTHISAILFCNSDAGNHPEIDCIGSDFTIVHNPYARNPLRRGLVPCGREYIVENNKVICQTPRASDSAHNE